MQKRSAPRTVHFSNNYSTVRAQELCKANLYPKQHLYGSDALAAAGFEIVILEHPPTGLAHSLSARAGWRAGDVRQLPRALRRGDGQCVDVAAEPLHVAGIAALRAWRWRRQPLVAVVHAPIRPSNFARRLVAGIDVAVCMSRAVQAHLIQAFDRSPQTTLWAPWGPDLTFPGYVSQGEDFVLSSGKTRRDVATLLAALEGTSLPAKVYGTPGYGVHLAYHDVLADLQRAAIVAVPLLDQRRLAGLSEIVDALALGKPIVVTKSPWLDVDVESIGCGIALEPGDTTGWRTALLELWHDAARRREMGRAARAFAEEHYNNALFGDMIVEAVRRASREIR